jgi:riboflavin transporter FmnP
MNARSVALITVFAAVAIILNTIRIPTIYWPGYVYTLCDIPVLVAFLVFGFRIGFLVEAIHIAGQEIFFPVGPAGIVVYPMGFFVHLFMFSGIYLASKLINSRTLSDKKPGVRKHTIYFTGFAVAVRGALMPIIDYAILYHILLPLVLSIPISTAYIVALVPSFVLYNVTSTLYTVPVAYLVAKKVSKYLRIETSTPM